MCTCVKVADIDDEQIDQQHHDIMTSHVASKTHCDKMCGTSGMAPCRLRSLMPRARVLLHGQLCMRAKFATISVGLQPSQLLGWYAGLISWANMASKPLALIHAHAPPIS
jgi:hypothetical protein|eukprot:SAG25_NODE_1432_length_3037_cov_14.282165_3_plen_110_part_00